MKKHHFITKVSHLIVHLPLRECVPLSTTSIVVFNTSSIHILLLVFEGIQFSCGANFLLYGSITGEKFSSLVVGSVVSKSNMLLHLM